MKKLFALILLPSIFTLSQSNQLQEALKFYPLQIGNYWQYKITKTSEGGTKTENWIGFVEIISDTLMPNGKKYYKIIDKRKVGNPYGSDFIRVDSLNGNIYSYSIPNEIQIDSLMASKGDGVDRWKCHIVSEDTSKQFFDTVFRTRYVKQYCISSYDETEWENALGIGEVRRIYLDKMYIIYCEAEILYAKINGKEYGIKSDIKPQKKLPDKICLFQNYPNPFNSSTIIEYELPYSTNVRIDIYDVLGRKVVLLVNTEQAAGNYKITFDAKRFSGGIYFYRIVTDLYSQLRKMIYLK